MLNATSFKVALRLPCFIRTNILTGSLTLNPFWGGTGGGGGSCGSWGRFKFKLILPQVIELVSPYVPIPYPNECENLVIIVGPLMVFREGRHIFLAGTASTRTQQPEKTHDSAWSAFFASSR